MLVIFFFCIQLLRRAALTVGCLVLFNSHFWWLFCSLYYGQMNALLCPFILVLIRIRRDDIEDEDDQESYYNYMKNAPVVAYPDDEEELEYDSDGNPIAPEKSKVSESIQYMCREQDLVSSSSIFKD